MLEEMLRVAGLENRLFILKKLSEKPMSVAEVRSCLRGEGISKPYVTVSRYLNKLKEKGFVVERDRKFHLTAKARLFMSHIADIEMEFRKLADFDEYLSNPMEYLPESLIRDIHVLGHAEVIRDPYDVMIKTIEELNTAEDYILIVNSRIDSRRFVNLSFRKFLCGLKARVVVDGAMVKRKVEMYREATRHLELSQEEIGIVKSNLDVRACSDVHVNIMVVDGKKAGITLPDTANRDFLPPSFYSSESDFVGWMERIFEWHWSRAEPIDW